MKALLTQAVLLGSRVEPPQHRGTADLQTGYLKQEVVFTSLSKFVGVELEFDGPCGSLPT